MKPEDRWETAEGSDGYYMVSHLKDGADGMAALRQIFPEAEANDMNFVIFSTSGIHGSYTTIEEIERDRDPENLDLTFLIIHPRIVATLYGTCRPDTPQDFAYLKHLRATSHRVMAGLGRAPL